MPYQLDYLQSVKFYFFICDLTRTKKSNSSYDEYLSDGEF
jgi:hypothetical protein